MNVGCFCASEPKLGDSLVFVWGRLRASLHMARQQARYYFVQSFMVLKEWAASCSELSTLETEAPQYAPQYASSNDLGEHHNYSSSGNNKSYQQSPTQHQMAP